MVLVGYRINGNRLRVTGKVDWMVFHSECKYLHQRRQGISKDKESVIVSPVCTSLSIL